MTKQLKKQFENQSQSGRSMIEMLGVLAIIAILSIGGIVGYKLAMNYYQADQIANEINLMRNDLKVKYALGNEELLLGDPYDETPDDEHYSGHLSTQYDRYPVDYDCIRKDKTEFYNCREADAYYIKVGNVSKGVCKPLTTLVNAMDALMYIEINKQPYEEDDLCSSDENNEFYIQFDAEDVNGNYDSERPEGWCAKDEDCDTSRPICDVENNECVECTENADCKDSGKPRCNIDLGNCESCSPETPIWYNDTCVECLTYNDCKNEERPQCEETSHTCKSCYELDPNKPLWDGTQCVECPADQPWNGEFCGCTSNENCATDEYCSITTSVCQNGAPVLSASDNTHCKEIAGNYSQKTINDRTYFSSTETMNWWGADNFCKAIAKKENKPYHLISIAELGCTLDDLNCENSELRHQLYNGTLPIWNIAVWTSTIDGDPACGAPYHAYVNGTNHGKRLEPCARDASIHYALCVADE